MDRPTPTVAIVGRPNVGKSTLFNRLIRERRAIVHDQPGVTRDRIVALADLEEGRPVQWVDTGGLVPGDDASGINAQVLIAVEASDLVLFLVDGTTGLTAADERVLDQIRPLRRPTLLVVNKADTRVARENLGEFWQLGLGEPALVSAEHGAGIGELVDRIGVELPQPEAEAAPAGGAIAVAVVGRPNVGKSSLVNRILGESRLLVSPVPGTTRDPIDVLLQRPEGSFLFVDTAGIRRRAKVTGAPEELAVLLARRQIERAEVAVLVIEAPTGVTSGDLAIAGAIWEAGRAAVVVINKWDLLDDAGRERLDRSFPRLAELLGDPPRVNVSAATGRGVEDLFERVLTAQRAFRLQVSTGELNRLLEQLLYATQVGAGPPTLMLFANRDLPLSHPYRRYLENRFREHFAVGGVPIRLVVRRRSTREKRTA